MKNIDEYYNKFLSRGISEYLDMSGKKMLNSIRIIYAPYLQEAEKMNLMLKSVDKKIKSHNSTDKGIKTRS
jgi:hypothetical protein